MIPTYVRQVCETTNIPLADTATTLPLTAVFQAVFESPDMPSLGYASDVNLDKSPSTVDH